MASAAFLAPPVAVARSASPAPAARALAVARSASPAPAARALAVARSASPAPAARALAVARSASPAPAARALAVAPGAAGPGLLQTGPPPEVARAAPPVATSWRPGLGPVPWPPVRRRPGRAPALAAPGPGRAQARGRAAPAPWCANAVQIVVAFAFSSLPPYLAPGLWGRSQPRGSSSRASLPRAHRPRRHRRRPASCSAYSESPRLIARRDEPSSATASATRRCGDGIG
jgi:hypothetical protein